MDVAVVGEGPHQGRVLGEVGEHPEFNLRVVGGQKEPAGLARHERPANLPAFVGPDGDVLEVRVGGTQPPRRRGRLVERGVHPAVVGVHEGRQGIDIRSLKFRQAPVLEHEFREGVPAGQFLQDRGVGRRPLALGGLLERLQALFVEQDLGQLLRRVDRELVAGLLGDCLLQGRHPALQVRRDRLQHPEVDRDAGVLHVRQDGHERHLDVARQGRKALLLEFRLQPLLQAPRDHGVLDRVLGHLVDGHGVHRPLVLLRAQEVRDRDHLVPEVVERQRVQPVLSPAGVRQVRRDHGVEERLGQVDAGPPADQQVVLDVLADQQASPPRERRVICIRRGTCRAG